MFRTGMAGTFGSRSSVALGQTRAKAPPSCFRVPHRCTLPPFLFLSVAPHLYTSEIACVPLELPRLPLLVAPDSDQPHRYRDLNLSDLRRVQDTPSPPSAPAIICCLSQDCSSCQAPSSSLQRPLGSGGETASKWSRPLRHPATDPLARTGQCPRTPILSSCPS
jgi:hypothetical protein